MSEHISIVDKLRQEMAVIAYKDLQREFARGVLVHVSTNLDLLDVALAINADNSAQVGLWHASGDLQRVDDACARNWLQDDAQLLTLVVAPWVLAQAKNN